MNRFHCAELLNGNSSSSSSKECEDQEAFVGHHQGGSWTFLEFLHVYYIPSIAVMGILGNTLSMLVFLCTPLRSRSSSYYLAALAAADSTFLAQLLLVFFTYLDLDIYTYNGGCQLLVYLSSVSTFMSVWLIVSFTLERFIAIQYPLQRPNMCTVQRAKMTIVGLLLFALLSYSYILFSATVIQLPSGQLVCDVHPGFEYAFYAINIVDTVATLILPVTLIVFMNTMIAVQLLRFSRCTATYLAKDSVPTSQMSSRLSSSVHHQCGNVRPPSSLFHKHVSNVACVYYFCGATRATCSFASKTLSQRAQYNVTKMLLLISTVFICLNLPSYVMRLRNYYFDNSESSVVVQHYTMILFYTNFSVNFLLYSIYGAAFRRALVAKLATWRRRRTCRQFERAATMLGNAPPPARCSTETEPPN